MILVVVMCPGRGCDSGGQWGGDHDRVWTAVEAAIKELDPPAGHRTDPARLVPQSDELGQPAVEAAPTGVAADNRASPIGLTIRSGEEATPPFSPCWWHWSLGRGLLAAACSQGHSAGYRSPAVRTTMPAPYPTARRHHRGDATCEGYLFGDAATDRIRMHIRSQLLGDL